MSSVQKEKVNDISKFKKRLIDFSNKNDLNPFSEDQGIKDNVRKVLSATGISNAINTISYDYIIKEAMVDKARYWFNTLTCPDFNITLVEIKETEKWDAVYFRIKVTGERSDLSFWRQAIAKVLNFIAVECNVNGKPFSEIV